MPQPISRSPPSDGEDFVRYRLQICSRCCWGSTLRDFSTAIFDSVHLYLRVQDCVFTAEWSHAVHLHYFLIFPATRDRLGEAPFSIV